MKTRTTKSKNIVPTSKKGKTVPAGGYVQQEPGTPVISSDHSDQHDQSAQGEHSAQNDRGVDLPEHSDREERQELSEQAENRIREIVREEIAAVMGTIPTVPHALPGKGHMPRPKILDRRKKENRRYKKMSLTVDEVLADMLVKEAEKARTSPGKILDAALWERYGRPKLSYQSDPSDSEGK